MCLFEVTVSLTEQGQPLWQDVAGLVLHYIQLLAQVCGGVGVMSALLLGRWWSIES